MSDYVEEYNHNDLDEIVFENRNKAYGAYDLRKSYRGILTKAFLIGVLLFSLAIAIPFVMMKIKQMNAPKETNITADLTDLLDNEIEEEIIIDEPEPEPEPEPEKPEEIEVIQNVVPEPVKAPKVETPPPPISKQKTTTTGLKNREGKKTPNATPPPPPPKNPGKGKSVNVKPPVDPNKIYKKVEQEAEFPGGIDAFREYIQEEFDNSVIEDEDDVVTTTVTFVVEKNGSITKIKASGGPAEYKEEAIRTIKSIRKKWKPAKVDGKPVRYRYRIPISMAPPEF